MPHGSYTVSDVTAPVVCAGTVVVVEGVVCGTVDPVASVAGVVVSTGARVVIGDSSGPAETTFSLPATQADASSENERERKTTLSIAVSVESRLG